MEFEQPDHRENTKPHSAEIPVPSSIAEAAKIPSSTGSGPEGTNEPDANESTHSAQEIPDPEIRDSKPLKYYYHDGAITTEKPVSQMTYEERFKEQGLVEHFGDERKTEAWSQGLTSAEKACERFQEFASADSVIDVAGASVRAWMDRKDAGKAANLERLNSPAESSPGTVEEHPDIRIYRQGRPEHGKE